MVMATPGGRGDNRLIVSEIAPILPTDERG